jgi:hypothetical protein
MILAAHQPHYLPWLGYLHKLASADLFVVMDDLQYEAQNFQNRNRVKLSGGAQWLTVPLERGPQAQRILDKRINNDGANRDWARRHWETLRNSYGRAPYFERYAGELESMYSRRWEWLLDLDLHVLQLMTGWLGIRKPIVRASTLELQGIRSARIVDLCRKTGATTYLSGGGGSRAYLETDLFARENISVLWQQFTHPVYPQRYTDLGFVSRLAAIDLLFNCGEESRDILLGAPAPSLALGARP